MGRKIREIADRSLAETRPTLEDKQSQKIVERLLVTLTPT